MRHTVDMAGQLTRRKTGAKTVEWLGLSAFVLAVYLIVVLAGGLLLGTVQLPHVGLSVLATAIIAVGFEPVRRRLQRFTTRLFYGGRLSPYEVLARFPDTVASAYSSEDLPDRMAQVLVQGTGVEWAQVWLTVRDGLALAATWPAEASADLALPVVTAAGSSTAGSRVLGVYDRTELLGALRVHERENQPLTPVEEQLFAGLAAQAGLALRGTQLRTELSRRLAELQQRADELQTSRTRVIEAQDAERRRLERDLHDGAQQQLIALIVNLRLAQTLLKRSPVDGGQLLGKQRDRVEDTIDSLSGLSRGLYPTDSGLEQALRAAAAASAIRVDLRIEDVGRQTETVEAATYFCCLEALQNAAKHSAASHIDIELEDHSTHLVLRITDDGRGFVPGTSADGRGLVNMRERIESVDGRLSVVSSPAAGTVITAEIPTAPSVVV
jgi:signal transduction histidine kinase